MLKRTIKYEDFDGNIVEETFYFNLTKTEVVEIETSYPKGLEEMIRQIINTQDRGSLVRIFQDLILLSYGIKSADGKSFIKSDELRTQFKHHAAFDALFTELATNEQAGADFIIGVLPKDLGEKTKQEMDNQSPIHHHNLQPPIPGTNMPDPIEEGK